MGVLILLALLAVITWNVFVQVGARQQATISTSDDVASARRRVSAAFGATWARVEGKGDDNFRPKLRMRAPVLSVTYEPNGAGGSEVDIWCSHFNKKYGCMEHAQLMWRKKRAVARLLSRGQSAPPQASNQQVGFEQASMQPEMGFSSVHNALSGRSPRQGSLPYEATTRLIRQLPEGPGTFGSSGRGNPRLDSVNHKARGVIESASDLPTGSGGFSEGDRVRLAKPFWGKVDSETGTLLKDWSGPDRGDPPAYPAGSQGTIIYPDSAPPEIILKMKANGNYLVAMDDGRRLYAGGPFPGVEGAALERISGRYQVAHQDGKVYLRPKFNAGDHVRLKVSFTSQNSGKAFEAGWEGTICPLTVTMTECWRTGYYPVSMDDDPFGADRGMINVPAQVLELILLQTRIGR
jgi:hypothetical protein